MINYKKKYLKYKKKYLELKNKNVIGGAESSKILIRQSTLSSFAIGRFYSLDKFKNIFTIYPTKTKPVLYSNNPGVVKKNKGKKNFEDFDIFIKLYNDTIATQIKILEDEEDAKMNAKIAKLKLKAFKNVGSLIPETQNEVAKAEEREKEVIKQAAIIRNAVIIPYTAIIIGNGGAGAIGFIQDYVRNDFAHNNAIYPELSIGWAAKHSFQNFNDQNNIDVAITYEPHYEKYLEQQGKILNRRYLFSQTLDIIGPPPGQKKKIKLTLPVSKKTYQNPIIVMTELIVSAFILDIKDESEKKETKFTKYYISRYNHSAMGERDFQLFILAITYIVNNLDKKYTMIKEFFNLDRLDKEQKILMLLKEWLNHVVQEVFLLPWLFYNKDNLMGSQYSSKHEGCYHLNDTLFWARDMNTHDNYTNSRYAKGDNFINNILVNHAFGWISYFNTNDAVIFICNDLLNNLSKFAERWSGASIDNIENILPSVLPYKVLKPDKGESDQNLLDKLDSLYIKQRNIITKLNQNSELNDFWTNWNPKDQPVSFDKERFTDRELNDILNVSQLNQMKINKEAAKLKKKPTVYKIKNVLEPKPVNNISINTEQPDESFKCYKVKDYNAYVCKKTKR